MFSADKICATISRGCGSRARRQDFLRSDERAVNVG
jgi:hypothetical protein